MSIAGWLSIATLGTLLLLRGALVENAEKQSFIDNFLSTLTDISKALIIAVVSYFVLGAVIGVVDLALPASMHAVASAIVYIAGSAVYFMQATLTVNNIWGNYGNLLGNDTEYAKVQKTLGRAASYALKDEPMDLDDPASTIKKRSITNGKV